MKTLINISILFILLNVASYSQFYADSVTPNYVIEFWKIADENAKQNDPEKGLRKNYSDSEIEYIAALYYKCYNNDPVGFQKYVTEKDDEWEKAFVDVVTGKIKIRPWMKVYALKDWISYKYGISFAEVIGTPVFIRCKYIKWEYSDYYSIDINTKIKAHNFIFLVEDVLKGNKFFNVGDSISISIWPHTEYPSPDFIEGYSYLIPVTTNLGYEENTFNSIFNYLSNEYGFRATGKPPKTFPIENETIKDCDYFGIKDTSWTDFKKYFKDTYLIFE